MPLFKYQAKDMKGELISGAMEAENRAMVISRLQAMSYFPVKITEEASAKNKNGGGGFFGARIHSNDICELYRQLADLISAGIALVKALQIVSSQTPSLPLRQVLSDVGGDVQGGDTFGEALSHHPKVFSRLAVALITSGERGGFLPDVLQQLANFAEMEEELKGKVRAALAYPFIMVFVGAAVVTFLMIFVLPRIINIYTEMDKALPAVTEVLISITTFISTKWYVILVGMIIGGGVFWQYAKSKDGRRLIHTITLRIPILGQVVLKREISRFSRTFGQMLKNGVPMLQALEIVKDVAVNDLIREAIAKAPADITQGEGVSGTLRKCNLFPRGMINMIAIGEETGRLPDVLLQIAPSYEAQSDRMIKTLTSLIEPLVILLMGIVVGFIVIAMLLPILTMNMSG